MAHFVLVLNYGELLNIVRGPCICPSHSGRCRRDFGEGFERMKRRKNAIVYSCLKKCLGKRTKGEAAETLSCPFQKPSPSARAETVDHGCDRSLPVHTYGSAKLRGVSKRAQELYFLDMMHSPGGRWVKAVWREKKKVQSEIFIKALTYTVRYDTKVSSCEESKPLGVLSKLLDALLSSNEPSASRCRAFPHGGIISEK